MKETYNNIAGTSKLVRRKGMENKSHQRNKMHLEKLVKNKKIILLKLGLKRKVIIFFYFF
jgi:hypothetical protein